MPKIINDIGKKYGRLTILASFRQNGKKTFYKCLCDCGKEVTSPAGNIRKGKTKSCGCLKIEKRIKHGDSYSQTYKAWDNIRSRCYNEKHNSYPNYGGRGVTMYSIWRDDYVAFRDYIGYPPEDGQRYTVDRIDSNGNYEPGNVRWATYGEQAKNRGMSSRNTTGVPGISFDQSRNRYKAQWLTLAGKNQTKVFTVKKYGKEEAFRLACEARENAIKELNSQGAGYSDSHGSSRDKLCQT